MTDVDAMHRDVQKLKAFQTRVENAIAFVEYMQKVNFDPVKAMAAAPAAAPLPGTVGMSDADRASLKTTLDGFGDRLSKLELDFSNSGQDAGLATRIATVEDEMKTLSTDFIDRVTAMLTWFDANKDGLEILLSLDGDPDQAPADSTPATPAAPAATIPGATDGTSAPADATGTAAPGTDAASPAASPAAPGTI